MPLENPSSFPAENRSGFPALVLALFWAALTFFYYFFSVAHPIGHVLPFFSDVFDLRPFSATGVSSASAIVKESIIILLTSFAVCGTIRNLGRLLRGWLSLDIANSWIRFAFDFGF